MAACTAINFVAVMAEQALADDAHSAFAEATLHELLTRGVRELAGSIEDLRQVLVDGAG